MLTRSVARLTPALAMVLAVAILTPVPGGSSPAAAQGFLAQLFGIGAAPPATTPHRGPAQHLRQTAKASAPASSRWVVVEEADRFERRAGGRSHAGEGSGSYTTMCVRMCDGFYFPISHRVPRSRFHADADACRSRCGESDARLFYFASAGGDMRSAVDLSGRAYARLPVAFAHRKRLVSGCTCRPEPWSQAAAIRHEGYAMAEGRSLSGGLGALTVVAGNYDKPAEPAAAPSEAQADAANEGERESADADQPRQHPGEPVASAASADRSVRPTTAPSSPARIVATPGRRIVQAAGRPAARAPVPRPAQIAQPRKPTRTASAAAVGGTRMVWPGDSPVRVR